MAVGLYDFMRPVAIAAGLGAGTAGQRGASLVIGVVVGVVFGAVAFVVAGRAMNRWLSASDTEVGMGPTHGTRRGEGGIAAAFGATFLVLLAATLAGSYLGHWLTHAAAF
jgi:hypothetical protein